MRIFGILQLVFCVPLAFACTAGFVRDSPQAQNVLLPASLGLIAVAATAGAGLLFRSDLCAYLATLTNIIFFIGCAILLGKVLLDLGQPLPARKYNTDDSPELTEIARNGAALLSCLFLFTSTLLLLLSFTIVRAMASRRA